RLRRPRLDDGPAPAKLGRCRRPDRSHGERGDSCRGPASWPDRAHRLRRKTRASAHGHRDRWPPGDRTPLRPTVRTRVLGVCSVPLLVATRRARCRRLLRYVLDLAARGTLTPPVPVVMPFGEYARALDT